MKNWISIVVLMFFIENADAQINITSLQSLLNYADKHSVTIQASVYQEEIGKYAVGQASSFLLPSINASSGFNDNLTIQSTLVPKKIFNPAAAESEFEEMKFGKQYTYNVGIQAQWNLLDFQKIFALQTSKLQLNSDKINTEKVKYNTYNQLASTYYSILMLQKSEEIFKENIKVTEWLLESANNKYSKGMISELELNQVKIHHIQNEKTLQNNQNNLKQLYNQLQTQLNTNDNIFISDDIENHLVSTTNFEKMNPEVTFQEQQLKVTESILKQSKSLYLPTLSVVYQYNYNLAGDKFMNFDNTNKLPSQLFGVKLNIPVFNGFYTDRKIRETATQVKIQQLQLDNLKLLADKDNETLRLQYEQSENALEKNKEILKLQVQNDKHTENKYQNGIISLDERMSKYNDLLNAQYDYLQSLADFSLSQYKIYIKQIDFN